MSIKSVIVSIMILISIIVMVICVNMVRETKNHSEIRVLRGAAWER